jgi:hypothetical protein
MNVRAQVTDAWREIWVTANALEADLDVIVNTDLNTLADAKNPFDFRASASSFAVGFQFDAPLNRQLERNRYRASLILYQRARRAFMARNDLIEQQIRQDLRSLQTERLTFEITRQSLIREALRIRADGG